MVTVFNSKGTTWWLASKVKAKQTPIYMDQVMDQTIPSRALAANLLKTWMESVLEGLLLVKARMEAINSSSKESQLDQVPPRTSLVTSPQTLAAAVLLVKAVLLLCQLT
jgi:hypothetical protein